MNIALCDDDSILVGYLSSLCQEIALVHSVTSYTSPDVLLTAIKEGAAFDAIIMDIEFETQKNGIDYAEEIYHTNPSIRTTSRFIAFDKPALFFFHFLFVPFVFSLPYWTNAVRTLAHN